MSLKLVNLTTSIAPSLSIYSGRCGDFDEVVCFSQNDKPVIDAPALAGQKLYLRVFTYNSEEGNSFSICAYEISCDPVINNVDRTTCEGTSVKFGTLTLTQEGLYSQTFKTSAGCDSLVKLTLRFNHNYQINDTVTVCSSEEYIFPDGTKKENIMDSFSHISRLLTEKMCDSIITTFIQVFKVDTTVVEQGTHLEARALNATFQWVNCDQGYLDVIGATNAVFVPQNGGAFAVRISQNGCSGISSCRSIVVVGILEEQSSVPFQVYPNPSREFLHLNLSEQIDDAIIELLTMKGELIFSHKFPTSGISVRTSDLPAGLYLLKVTTQNQSWVHRHLVLR